MYVGMLHIQTVDNQLINANFLYILVIILFASIYRKLNEMKPITEIEKKILLKIIAGKAITSFEAGIYKSYIDARRKRVAPYIGSLTMNSG